jgi:hypothetical protein
MTGSQAPPPKPPGPLPRRVPGSSRLMPRKRPEVPPPRLAGIRTSEIQGPEVRPSQVRAPDPGPRPPDAQAAGPGTRPADTLMAGPRTPRLVPQEENTAGSEVPRSASQDANGAGPEAPRPTPPGENPAGSENSRPGPEDDPAAGSEVPRPSPRDANGAGPEVPPSAILVRRGYEDGVQPPDGAQPPDGVQPPDGALTGALAPRPGTEVERQAAGSVAARPAAAVTPSWPMVVGTTVHLWVARRRTWWRVIAVVLVALVVFAGGGLTVALLRHTGSGNAARGGNGTSVTPGLAQVQAAAATRQQAAAWVTAQVSHSAVVSCDPAMCAVLEARGFPAGDLLTLGSAASDPLGSAVIVSTAAVRSEFGSRLTSVYAPTVLASFGSGSARVDVRVYAAGGAPVYLAALRADQQVRQNLGHVLLRNPRVTATPAARAQLAAGQVDTRLLAMLATLSGQGTVSIVGFGDSGPGASPGVPLRAVELASPPGAKAGYLPSVLALLQAQQPPYLANSATLARLSDGLHIVRVEFAAPSPLGLLSG